MLQSHPMYAYIPARDVARARKFYEGKIGLKPKKEIAGGVSYELGENTAVFLYDAGKSADTSKESQAFWKVHDVAKEEANHKARGIHLEHYGPHEHGGISLQRDV